MAHNGQSLSLIKARVTKKKKVYNILHLELGQFAFLLLVFLARLNMKKVFEFLGILTCSDCHFAVMNDMFCHLNGWLSKIILSGPIRIEWCK
jgi:hypothetical protein